MGTRTGWRRRTRPARRPHQAVKSSKTQTVVGNNNVVITEETSSPPMMTNAIE